MLSTASALALAAGLLSSSAHAGAEPLVGVDWVPLGRGDLTWIEEEQGSGTLVGELDGLTRPALTPWGGLAWERQAVIFGLGLARWSTSTWTAEQRTVTAMGAIRPSLDYRRYLLPREPERVSAWAGAGLSGVVPLVRYSSETWTAEEAEAMAESEATDRARIGAFGGRAGLGAEYWLTDQLALGGRWFASLHVQQWNGTDGHTVSSWLLGEGALTLTLAL